MHRLYHTAGLVINSVESVQVLLRIVESVSWERRHPVRIVLLLIQQK